MWFLPGDERPPGGTKETRLGRREEGPFLGCVGWFWEVGSGRCSVFRGSKILRSSSKLCVVLDKQSIEEAHFPRIEMQST